MCRFVLYSGPEITLDLLTTEPTNSIIHQSRSAQLRREPLNGDGFGISWYVPEISPLPAQFRSIQPAWNNANLKHIARMSRSEMVLAHVRAATAGIGVSELNCHPFIDGPFSFMHNGAMAEFLSVKRQLRNGLTDQSYLSIQGTTDSEHLFAIFLDHVRQYQDQDTVTAMALALESTIQDVVLVTGAADQDIRSSLNIAVSDGHRAVVSRCATDAGDSPSLYLLRGAKYTCENGVCSMKSGSTNAVLVASEPLTEDEAWELVPSNHLVLIDSDRMVTTRPIVFCQ